MFLDQLIQYAEYRKAWVAFSVWVRSGEETFELFIDFSQSSLRPESETLPTLSLPLRHSFRQAREQAVRTLELIAREEFGFSPDQWELS